MALNGSNKEHMERRRRWVARLRLHGLSENEIALKLPTVPDEGGPIVNPRTGEPYSSVTVHNDLKAIKRRWYEHSMADISELRAAQVAELQELRRTAWASKKYSIILSALKQEADLLGLNAPDLIAITDWTREVQEAGYDPADIFERYVEEAIANIQQGTESPST